MKRVDLREIAQRMRRRGITPTVQRMLVLEALQGRTDHPSADQIYEEVRRRLPSISRTTVYNALQLFRELGEIQELSVIKERAHYDPNPTPHHHFFCRRCRRLLDVEVACPIAKSGWVEGNRIEEVQACFYGVCAECLRREAP